MSPALLTTLAAVTTAFARLEPQVIRPAEGYIKRDYLIPAGYYRQMWDWDGFFIGYHLAQRGGAAHLRDWALNFAESADEHGYVAGCVTTSGPRPLFGKFAMKPFLAQGALLAASELGDYQWIAPVWDKLERVAAYRDETQFDAKWGLYFWDNAMQSGADNNVALSDDPADRSSILAVDMSVFQLRELEAMALIASRLKKPERAAFYQDKAKRLRAAVLAHLWSAKDQMFYNRRRDGAVVPRVSYSNFLPLIEDVIPEADARSMIKRYLWNPEHMLSPFGLRSLSKKDKDYNNVSMIDPYSNWQGPIWINANYLFFVALKRHGFDKEASELALRIGRIVAADAEKWGSMHENYDAETGLGLAPTPEQSPNKVFAGFVGWNLLAQDMLECAAGKRCALLELR
jgi:alpha,alpha-trehalase